jgi:hypothetical protein
MTPGSNDIKLFTAAIYCHFLVIPSFCVIKQYYHGHNHRMAVHCCAKKFYNIGPW